MADELDQFRAKLHNAQDSFIRSRIHDFAEKIKILDDILEEIREILGPSVEVSPDAFTNADVKTFTRIELEQVWLRKRMLARRYSQITSLRQISWNTKEAFEGELKLRAVTDRLRHGPSSRQRKAPL